MKSTNGRRQFQSPPSTKLPLQQNVPLTTNIGHNGTHVVMTFSQRIDNQMLTDGQCEAYILSLQNALKNLREYQAAQQGATP